MRIEQIQGKHGPRNVKVVKCACGQEVWCTHLTNTCTCGADYNGSGRLLAPRSQWGEETGECAGDVLVSDDALVASLDSGAW